MEMKKALDRAGEEEEGQNRDMSVKEKTKIGLHTV